MTTYLEHHLGELVGKLEITIDRLQFELKTAEQCVADYKKVTQSQQKTICELKDEIMATEVARYEYKA